MNEGDRPSARRNGLIVHRPQVAGPHAIAARFVPVLGKRFASDPGNVRLLGLAHAAFMGLKRAARSIAERNVNIFTQWVGDPDALGSAVVLKAVLEKLDAKEVRILTGALGHPQNRALVERCAIALGHPNDDRLPRALSCMVDTSPPLGMASTGLVDPVKDYFFVADHHTEAEAVEEDCRGAGVRRVRLAFVGLPVGSTSAFMSVLGAAFGVLDGLRAQGRAAAALGIYTDTSALLHGPTPLDFRMFEILTRDPETQDLLDDLRDYRVPVDWYLYRASALQNMEVKGAVRIAAVGFVRQELRDVIAEVASDLLRIEGTSIAIAIATSERGTEVSVRADSRLLGGDQQRIVRVIDYLLDYAFPGLSGFKYERLPPHRVEGGAFVPHDRLKERLWAPGGPLAAESSAATQGHCRECAKALLAALEDLSFARPEEIHGLL